MRYLIITFVSAFIAFAGSRCTTKIIDKEYVITQVIKNSTSLPVTFIVYSKQPQKRVTIAPNTSHTDKFSFDGIGTFVPVDSRFITDSVEIIFDNRLKTTYVSQGVRVSDNCLSKSIYCVSNYQEVDIDTRHKQYTYSVNQEDLAKAKQ